MAALTLVNTKGGNVVAVKKWLTHVAQGDVFAEWTSKIPGAASAIIRATKDGEKAEEFRITTHKHLRGRIRISNNRTSTELLKGYGVNIDTRTETGVRNPLAMVVDLDEWAQTLTEVDLSKISVKELGLMCGRFNTLLKMATLSAGAFYDSTNDRLSLASFTTAQGLMDQLRGTGTATYTIERAKVILNLANIGTDDCTSSHSGAIDYRSINAFFVKDGVIVKPTDLTAGSMWDNAVSDPDTRHLTYSALADLAMAADLRDIPPLEGGIMGELGPYWWLPVPKAVFADLLNDPDREEAMFNLGQRTDGLKEWSARNPDKIFHRGILVTTIQNKIDGYASDCIATPANAVAYPLHWPGVAEETSGGSNKYVVECPLIGAQCLGDSVAKTITIGESEENDGGTKPWLFGKWGYGAIKTTQMMPDGVPRYRCASVVCTTASSW